MQRTCGISGVVMAWPWWDWRGHGGSGVAMVGVVRSWWEWRGHGGRSE